MSNGKFENYKVLVAGSTSGIGLGITKMFIDEGATVLGLGRNFSKTEDLGPHFIPCKCDVTNMDELEAACNKVKEIFDGKLDVMVNSAGVGVHHSVKDVTSDRFDYAIDLLLRPSVMMTHFCYEYLYAAESKKPVIIHISSVGSRTIVPVDILYGMCKSSVNLFSKQTGAGLPGIRVFSVCPGMFKTPIFGRDSLNPRSAEQIDALYENVSKAVPSGRLADPSEMGDLIEFLCSDDAAYMTGCDCTIDGGLLTSFS